LQDFLQLQYLLMRKSALFMLGMVLFLTGLAAPPAITSFTPKEATTGITVTITGTNFTGATNVIFGSTPAISFTVISATQIKAVVGAGSSGNVSVVHPEGTATLDKFNYVTTSAIYTDFGGYWPSTMIAVNATVPDSSHNLLAFTYNGLTYSTGVNNAVLTGKGINYIPGQFKALPIAGISGMTGTGTSTYLALAKKVDGSAIRAYTPAVTAFSVKSVLIDGANGLDMGTGVTNLPASAVLNIQIFNIDAARITDNEPDIILTQIAAPLAGNDEFSFIDASGNIVGNKIMQDMTALPSFGNYGLDLYNLTPATPYNMATAYSPYSASETRNIRLVAFRLSDFGITSENVSQIRGLKLSPSSNSDYAFIAYNANAINLPPNVTKDDANSSVSLCSGGRARMTVIGTSAAGGVLSYQWEESANGSSWTTLANGGNYSGATTNQLLVTNPANGYQYRAIVSESGNANSATSASFTISIVATPAAPSSVLISNAGSSSFCLNTPTQLTSTVTGGSNHYYQWESNASGSFQEIPGANWRTFQPVINQTGTTSYRLKVSSGNGCIPFQTSNTITVTVSGVSSVTPAVSCGNASLTLNATASSGSVSWFALDTGGTAIVINDSYTTPLLNTSTTYYVTTSGCASSLRVPVSATIHPATVGGAINGGTTVTSLTNNNTLVLQGNTGAVSKWQSSTDGFAVNITDIANTTNQLEVTNVTKTTDYRALVQSGTCSQSFSSMATITVPVILPVTWVSFTAVKKDIGVELKWSTATEVNNDRFIIERSVSGAQYEAIGSVSAKGEGASYTFIDGTPKEGANYYRLKQVDKDGGYTYSNIRTVLQNGNQTLTLSPNPSTGIVEIKRNGAVASKALVRVMSQTGTLVYQGQHTGNRFKVDLSHLPAGAYIVKVDEEVLRLVITK
jgi:hypothetical protein